MTDLKNIPALQLKHIFGLRTDVAANIHFLDDEDILYPVGGVLVIHNFSQRRQRFIRLPDKGLNINIIVVSPNKKLVAVGEVGDPPSISIYDIATLKRKKQLFVPVEKPPQCNSFVCLSFTNDSRYVIAILGDPDWILYCFRWDKGKAENFTRANNMNNTGTIKQIACNPNDVGLVVLVGEVCFRLLACNENNWRQFGYSKAESVNFSCVAWLAQDRLITGTSDGRLLIIESGELKAVYNAEDLYTVNLQHREDGIQTSVTSLAASTSGSTDQEIRCLKSFSKGFAFSYKPGVIYLFEKETPVRYKKRNVFILENLKESEDNEQQTVPLNTIMYITVNPIQDTMVVTCYLPQLFSVSLWGPDMQRQPEIRITELGPAIHRGAIYKMSVCKWKPLLMTAGKEDRSIRIWNYEKEDLILSKLYQEDVYGIDLHPTGLYAVVGFSGKLRFLTILIDDFAITREFAIRYCTECRFSLNGHLFAAVNGNIIQVYSSITFNNVVNLKGHNGRVTSLCWTLSDYKMVSCGVDGAIYEWDIASGKRITEVIVKTCKFTGTQVTLDSKINYSVGSDGEIKEIVNGIIRTAQVLESTGLDCIVLSNSDLMMFVSARCGTVFSIRLPLSEKPEFLDYNVHNHPVTQLKISYDDKYLLTSATDGTVCFWKLVNTMGKTIKLDKDFVPSTEILIPYDDLEEKIYSIKDLTMRMGELDTEHSYQMRQTEGIHAAKIKEVHEAYCAAIEELKEKNTQLISEHAQECHTINMEINNMKRGHDMAIQNLESTYNEKLILEYTKYLELEDKLGRVRKEYDGMLENLEDQKKAAEAALVEKYTQALADKDVIIEELKEEIEQRNKEHEIIKQQIEDDADREIYELKTSHECELKEELETNIKIRAENAIYCKKVVAFQKEVDELKHQIFTLEGEHVKFKTVILDLEKNINELKKEITERDATLQDKEKRIHSLKSKNQEMEKYKYVLEFQIEDLKSQIEPRERRIHDQKEQIDDMVNELENLQKIIESLELQLAELREKLSASHVEYKREQAKFRQAQDLLKAMRIDLHRVSGLIQEPSKLKIGIRDMYHKYNADKEFVITQGEDCEVGNEFLKQRTYLEKTVQGLKRFNSKKRDDSGIERMKVMEESAELIVETNTLRTELKNAQRQNRKMESVLGLSAKFMLPKEAQRKLSDAVSSKKTIHALYHEQLEDYEAMILSLKEENKRLSSKLNPKKSKSVQYITPEL